jgi:hypothetical protein
MTRPNYCPDPDCGGEDFQKIGENTWRCRVCDSEFSVREVDASEIEEMVENEIQGAETDTVTTREINCGECGEDLNISKGVKRPHIDWVKIVCSNCGKINDHSIIRHRRIFEQKNGLGIGNE